LEYQRFNCKPRPDADDLSRPLSEYARRTRWGTLKIVKLLRFFPLCAALPLMLGCETMPLGEAGPTADEVDSAAPVVLPFPEPEPVSHELDEDLVYSYLVGEIASRRGQLGLAQTHYQHAAILARDAYAAERATRIALHLQDYAAGLESVRRWVELAPNDETARQLAAILFLRNGQPDEAGRQLDALIQIAEARGNDGFLQAASALSVEQDHDGTERLMLGLRERHPDDIRSLYALGVLKTAHRRYGEAEEILRTVIDEEPGREQPRVLLSRVLVAQDKREQALEVLADGVDDFPDSKILRTSYARMLVDASDYPAALAQFRALRRLAPDDDELAFGYAMLATQQEEWDEARAAWQELRGNPERRDEASYYLAQIEEQSDNDELALGLYKTVSGEELRVDASMRIAQILARSGRLPEARDTLQQARIASPRRAVDLYVTETQLVQRYGEPADALALYQVAIEAFPEDHDLAYNRALFVLEQGDFDAMERGLRRILQQDPDHVDSLNALGYTLADRNERIDEAFALISRAYRLRPDSAAILDSMGWVLYRMGELEQAAAYLRRALALGHDDEIAAHLGEVLWFIGRRDEAESVWREALVHTPDSERIQAVLERLRIESL
jgi:tetratricopeptide (TPR) repeat protein